MTIRPYVFIGSSSEGLAVAKAIQAELQYAAECEIWHQGMFGLSQGTLDTLVGALDKFDFAILVLTPDDLEESRGEQRKTPRDNVLLELGMLIGGLGRSRTFMVVDRSAQLKLPSDLAGISPATFQPPESGSMQAAVGPACTAISDAINGAGKRKDSEEVNVVYSLFQDIHLGEGVSFIVTNDGTKDFPPYQPCIFHPKLGSYFIFEDEKVGRPLLPKQKRSHRCPLFANGKLCRVVGLLTTIQSGLSTTIPSSEQLPEEEDEDFELRLILEDSDNVVLFSDSRMGQKLIKLVRRVQASGKFL